MAAIEKPALRRLFVAGCGNPDNPRLRFGARAAGIFPSPAADLH
jgi:hypothetical protein